MSEAKVIINYESIVKAIGKQFQDVWSALSETEDDGIKKLISNITSIEISDEQSFVSKRKKQALLQGTLYIAVRFGSGAINYANSVTPISLYCVGTANKVKPAQLILGVFCSTWTTKNLAQELIGKDGEDLEIHNALQVWNTPEIITNFNEVDADFKNLFRVTGNIVVGPSAIRMGKMTYYFNKLVKTPDDKSVTVYTSSQDFTGWTLNKEVPIEDVPEESWPTVTVTDWDTSDSYAIFESFKVTFDATRGVFILHGIASPKSDELNGDISFDYSYTKYDYVPGSETVNVMSYQDGLQSSLNSQAFGNTNGFTKSEVNFSTFAFTISTYLVNGQLGKDMLALRGFRYRPNGQYSYETSKFSANDYVKIKLEFTNGYTNMPEDGEATSDKDPVKGDEFYCKYKVVSSKIGQEIAGIPNLTIAFTR